MNTNNNVYTVVYTSIVVVVVAAVLAFASQSLKSRQDANIKAETLSQMMTAAGLGKVGEFGTNDEILGIYSENIEEAFAVNLAGDQVRTLKTEKYDIELIDNFKPQDIKIKAAAGDVEIPVYKFKSGATVIAIYGAGLWGPIWGYVALAEDMQTIIGVYFDHSSETPGLGAKIKDDPAFQAQFQGKVLNLDDPSNPFDIVKRGAPEGALSMVDAITGSTMTCNGLDDAIDVWVEAYANYLNKARTPETPEVTETTEITEE